MLMINTNTASSLAAYNLGGTTAQLQKSLQRLSSGSRINNSSDDAGGLAVSMKLSASIRRTEATISNVSNAIAFLQTQDGALKVADQILNRMSELAAYACDVTKTSDDRSLYNEELGVLQSQLYSMLGEQFNGISLFSGGAVAAAATGITSPDNIPDLAPTLGIVTSQDGAQSIGITQADLESISYVVGTSSSQVVRMNFTTLADATGSLDFIQEAIQRLATIRATNGAQQSRLTFAADLLAINKTNLEAANSRIADVDIAKESAELARAGILQQAGIAMLSQANVSNQSTLRLLL
jgi:flagellin